MTTETTSPRFDDYRNIQVGRARVIWAPAWAYLPEAWVLPGGRRTESFAEAHAVAVLIDQLTISMIAKPRMNRELDATSNG